MRFVDLASKIESVREEPTHLPRPSFVKRTDSWLQARDVAFHSDVSFLFLTVVGRASWWNELPEGVRQIFEFERAKLAQSQKQTLVEVDRILKQFRDQGLPFIVFGETDLSLRLYESIYYRPVRNLDVLIEPIQLPRALEAVGSIGYRAHDSSAPVCSLNRKKSSLNLKIRTSMIQPHGDKWTEGVWSRSEDGAESVSAGTRVMAPEDAIVHSMVRLEQNTTPRLAENDLFVLLEKFRSIDVSLVAEILLEVGRISRAYRQLKKVAETWSKSQGYELLTAVYAQTLELENTPLYRLKSFFPGHSGLGRLDEPEEPTTEEHSMADTGHEKKAA